MIRETKESIALYYREGRSDKVYQVQLAQVQGGYLVNFQFGRRGSTLQSGTKTNEPVSYERARKIYDRLVAEKKAKGYTEAEEGTPYQNSEQVSSQSGLAPQLLNAIDEKKAQELIADRAWIMQEKKDGCRLLVRKSGSKVEGINRKGQFVALAKTIAQAIASLGCDVVLDGEAVGDIYWAFDLLELRGEDLRPLGTSSRLTALLMLLEASPTHEALRPIHSAGTASAKQELFERLKAERSEGVVFKHIDAKYVPGRPNSGGDHLKFKFTSTATCKVLGRNGPKRSVALALSQHPGDGWVDVGNVTIPPKCQVPKTGSLVEVRYLYAYPGGSLYQPVYCRERLDVDVADSVNTLKFKQGEDDDN